MSFLTDSSKWLQYASLSTFMHSGVTGLMSAAYNGAKGVIIILDNGTTAMTGGQPNPATGTGIRGKRTKKIVIEDLAREGNISHHAGVLRFRGFTRAVRELIRELKRAETAPEKFAAFAAQKYIEGLK